MQVPTESRTVTVALIGNPNTGKSTLFNALCGLRQRVGNYPGVTVEKKIGRTEIAGRQFQIVDLPGSYSLAPRSPDEMVAVAVLLSLRDDVPPVDAVVCIVDASNLERNLYLVNQVLELSLPTVIVLNMIDLARDKGQSIDVDELAARIGVPIVEVQANRRIGLAEFRTALLQSLDGQSKPVISPFPPVFQDEVAHLKRRSDQSAKRLPGYLVERLLLDTSEYLANAGLPGVTPESLTAVHDARKRLIANGCPIPAIEAMSRYEWVEKVTEGVLTKSAGKSTTLTDRLDRILTHRILGTLIFVVVMFAIFESMFAIGEWASAGIDWLTQGLSEAIASRMSVGALRSLIVDGVIAGVGGVITFLPQIFVLFGFIAILEDCGYMARAAYLMDKLMSRVGLSGKSFIPLLSSFACAIPGIMSARVIENPRDRLLTILVAPLMSCSARFPVYTLMISAFIPNEHWLPGLPGLRTIVLFAMYLVGVFAAVGVTWLLRRTIFRGPTPPFVMELPTFKLPGAGLVVHRMWDSGWSFVRRAGTLILAVSILVWATAYYPRSELPAGAISALDEGEQLRNSYLGRAGHWIEPAVRPLGWDWRLGCAAVASFPAREVVVATLGVIYNLGRDQDEESEALRETLKAAKWEGTDRLVFNIPVALSLMVFFALCAQCVSTLVVMRRETNSWRWPAFTFVYMTVLAYAAALVTYQVGMLF